MSGQSTLKEKNYKKASEASKLVGYSSDYITRLAREGKIDAKQVNRQWLVDLDSLKLFSLNAEAEKRERGEKLKEERMNERAAILKNTNDAVLLSQLQNTKSSALGQTAILTACLLLFVNILWFSFESRITTSPIFTGVSNITAALSEAIIAPIPDFITQTASFSFVFLEDDSQRSAIANNLEVKKDQYFNQSDFEGIVIVEDDETETNPIDKVRHSFSDELVVNFDTENSGVITPVFRDSKGESYRFLLIPANESGD